MVTNSRDPRGNLGFVQEEEEEMAVGEDYSDDSDSDDDIERYVFLARQPALVDSQAQAEDDTSSDDDDDDDDDDDGDAIPDGEAAGGRGGKRLLLREIFDASPSRKKARVDLTPLAQAGPSGSETSSSPFGARGHVMVGVPEQQGEAKNKKCGKRRSPDSEAGEKSHRALTAAAAAAADSGASRRFHCNICGRCFGSHQALGGHVLGHKKKAKNAIVVAASHEDVAGGNGYYNQKMDVVAVSQEVANGNGNSNSNKNAVIAASHEHTNGNGDDEENAITLSSYGYANGNSNSDEEMTIVAANQNDHNADGAAKEKKVLAAASCNEADGNGDAKEKKVVVGRCHKGASNGNNSVRKTQHKCEVCGKECLSGQALGGHMRKHRERPAGEGRSARPASASDSQPPTVRPISAEICLQRAVVITGEQPGQRGRIMSPVHKI